MEHTAYTASIHTAAGCAGLHTRSGDTLRTGLPGHREHWRASAARNGTIPVSSVSLPADAARARDQRGERQIGTAHTARRPVSGWHADRRRVCAPEKEDSASRRDEGSDSYSRIRDTVRGAATGLLPARIAKEGTDEHDASPPLPGFPDANIVVFVTFQAGTSAVQE
jgi:hypothetical protein